MSAQLFGYNVVSPADLRSRRGFGFLRATPDREFAIARASRRIQVGTWRQPRRLTQTTGLLLSVACQGRVSGVSKPAVALGGDDRLGPRRRAGLADRGGQVVA